MLKKLTEFIIDVTHETTSTHFEDAQTQIHETQILCNIIIRDPRII